MPEYSLSCSRAAGPVVEMFIQVFSGALPSMCLQRLQVTCGFHFEKSLNQKVVQSLCLHPPFNSRRCMSKCCYVNHARHICRSCCSAIRSTDPVSCPVHLNLRHMKVPRLGVESALQLPAYTTATTMWDLSHICDLRRSSL